MGDIFCPTSGDTTRLVTLLCAMLLVLWRWGTAKDEREKETVKEVEEERTEMPRGVVVQNVMIQIQNDRNLLILSSHPKACQSVLNVVFFAGASCAVSSQGTICT